MRFTWILVMKTEQKRKRVAEIPGTPFVLQVYWDRSRDGVSEMVRGYVHCNGCEGNAYACDAQRKLEKVIEVWAKAFGEVLG